MNQIFGIVGYGIVGKATHKTILKDKEVCIHDLLHNTSFDILKTCDVVFFCIPTASSQDLET